MGFGVAHITNDDWRTERTLPGGRWIVKGRSGWGAIPHPSVLPNPPSEWLKKKSEIDPALAKLDALTAFNLEILWKELVAESCGKPRVVTYSY
jgi:hypothetical protein